MGFNRMFIRNAIDRSAESGTDRRSLLRAFGLAGAGAAAGSAALAGLGADAATAEEGGPSDGAILNFALNLEYLEAEFYQRAAFGRGLDESLTDGRGTQGRVRGGKKVPFQSKVVRQYAEEIAKDELEHVRFLRQALGSAKVAEPAIDINEAFTAAARAAGVIGPGETFDAYANDTNFLLAAYIFEDVGVTAYKGAAPLVDNKTFVDAAAGILAVEAYHASELRTTLYAKGQDTPALIEGANKISAARGQLDNGKDQGIQVDGAANIVPADKNAIAFGRTPGEVLNIVYLNPGTVSRGGFFPDGVNGPIRSSGKAPTTGGADTGAGDAAGDQGTTPHTATSGTGGDPSHQRRLDQNGDQK
ncbi:ferritin-like domain-containing protein [Actinopolyspora mortivallis]|uniref:Ferritin-like domain-containing protein n=1 Tax=Actinopolyspora mortivallis TaxID=33906 RepID=A0A2T0GVG7_ACTMO|nr:hypothetical protein CEP50_12285 [Actinopolyspora mortivallis]